MHAGMHAFCGVFETSQWCVIIWCESMMFVLCISLFRTNENNINAGSVIITPVPEEVIVNGEQSDDEDEVPPSDDEEQEDSKDYCIGEYQQYFWFNYSFS